MQVGVPEDGAGEGHLVAEAAGAGVRERGAAPDQDGEGGLGSRVEGELLY